MDYVFFMFDGKQYRSDWQGQVVERLEDGGIWKRVHTGRIIRAARMRIEERLNAMRGGK